MYGITILRQRAGILDVKIKGIRELGASISRSCIAVLRLFVKKLDLFSGSHTRRNKSLLNYLPRILCVLSSFQLR